MDDQLGPGSPGGQYPSTPKPVPAPPPPYYPYHQAGLAGHPYPPPIPSRQRHSGLGIASFILSLVSGAGMFVTVLIAGIISIHGGMDEDSPETLIIGFLTIFAGFLCLVALGMGIAGCAQAKKKRAFAVLGSVFSATTLLLTGILMIIGLAAS